MFQSQPLGQPTNEATKQGSDEPGITHHVTVPGNEPCPMMQLIAAALAFGTGTQLEVPMIGG